MIFLYSYSYLPLNTDIMKRRGVWVGSERVVFLDAQALKVSLVWHKRFAGGGLDCVSLIIIDYLILN